MGWIGHILFKLECGKNSSLFIFEIDGLEYFLHNALSSYTDIVRFIHKPRIHNLLRL